MNVLCDSCKNKLKNCYVSKNSTCDKYEEEIEYEYGIDVDHATLREIKQYIRGLEESLEFERQMRELEYENSQGWDI